MLLQIIATRDIVSNCYSNLMCVPSLGGAVRSFGDECTKPGTQFNQHPEDYELWHIGEYEDESGTIRVFEPTERKQLAAGANYRNTTRTN